MTNWFEQYKKIVLTTILVLFLLLLVFYSFLMRPLAAEEKMKREQLNRVEEDTLFYQQELNKLQPQKFTEEEQQLLVRRVPTRPNVEELIKDIEKTELDTGIVIENIGVTNSPNELNVEKEQQPTSETSEPDNNETVQPSEISSWEHIFPSDSESYQLIQEKLAAVSDITLSFVEISIDVIGSVEDVKKFADKLESLNRIIHIQNYDYVINEDQDSRLEGNIKIRAFYSEDFKQFIDEDLDFKLDYEFSPDKIKEYIGINNSESNSSEDENENAPIENHKEQNYSLEKEPSSNTEDKNDQLEEEEAPFFESNRLSFYEAPNNIPMESAPLFHVVQTGAYIPPHDLNSYVNKLLEEDIYARVIEDEFSYIYTGAFSNKKSAQIKADLLNQQGFESYVKNLPFRLTRDEIELLLSEANDVIGAFNEILSNTTPQKNYKMTDAQIEDARLKIKAYNDKVQLAMERSNSESRKQELQRTILVLSELERLLLDSDTTIVPETLGRAEGLILDFMLILNSYVPSNVKGSYGGL
jgi:Tfp pilus assembly protein PilO